MDELGFSWNTFDELTQFVVTRLAPAHILDIGSGAGKYGRLLKPLLPESELIGLDADPKARPALLACGYDEARLGVAADLYRQADQTYDLVILGDVIEHMRHSEGRDLLEFLLYRSAYILIVTPECMPQLASDFYWGHNSVWRPESLAWHDLWASMRSGQMHFYLLRGHQNWQAPTLQSIVQAVAEAKLQVPHQNLGRIDACLELHDSVTVDHLTSTTAVQFRPL